MAIVQNAECFLSDQKLNEVIIALEPQCSAGWETLRQGNEYPLGSGRYPWYVDFGEMKNSDSKFRQIRIGVWILTLSESEVELLQMGEGMSFYFPLNPTYSKRDDLREFLMTEALGILLMGFLS